MTWVVVLTFVLGVIVGVVLSIMVVFGIIWFIEEVQG